MCVADRRSPAHALGNRPAYLAPARGKVKVNSITLDARDGAAVNDEPTLTIEALADLPRGVMEGSL